MMLCACSQQSGFFFFFQPLPWWTLFYPDLISQTPQLMDVCGGWASMLAWHWKVNLAIRTACGCSSSSPSAPPTCWLGTAAPLVFAAPPYLLRWFSETWVQYINNMTWLNVLSKANNVCCLMDFCSSAVADLVLPLGYNGDSRLGQGKVMMMMMMMATSILIDCHCQW